jgi:hypothetical protein
VRRFQDFTDAAHLRQNVARLRAFGVITADEPADIKDKIVELYKERWKMFPEVAKLLSEGVGASLPYR